MTSQQLASGSPPGSDPNVWDHPARSELPYFPWAPVSTIPNIVLPTQIPPLILILILIPTLIPTQPQPNSNPNIVSNPNSSPPSQPQIIDNLTGGFTLSLAAATGRCLPFPRLPGRPVLGPQLVGEPRLIAWSRRAARLPLPRTRSC